MENSSQHLDFSNTQLSTPETPQYEIITTGKKKAYKCLIENCERVFRFKSDMTRHKIVHTKDRPYACKYPSCSKRFKRPDALKNHLKGHNDNFPFVCLAPGCKLRFNKKSALQYHLQKHNDEQFNCDSLGSQKSFLASKILDQHKITTESQQKFILSSPQNLKQEAAAEDCDKFLNHFENLAPPEQKSSSPNISKKNSFDEDFSPKSEKFLHTEAGRANCPQALDSLECKISDLNSSETSSRLCFEDFAQLMICKFLWDENQQMKAQLDIKTDPVKANFENRLNCMLKKVLSCKNDMSGAISSTN